MDDQGAYVRNLAEFASLDEFTPAPANTPTKASRVLIDGTLDNCREALGEGHSWTWRSRCFKVAVEIIVGARRVLLRLSASWPHLDELFRVVQLVAAPAAQHKGS